ncbi:MAG: CBS domain-containing protein [Deltaproteobacteria bacterium]|nr:CBS domain-containing protein [Deltaproteobacteria bacterium]
MSTVDRLLGSKGRKVFTISSKATVFEAIASMDSCNVGSLVVVDGGTPCGILTERDYLRRVALQGRSSKTTLVEEIMSAEMKVVDPQTDLEACMAMMADRHIRHLPVVDDGKLVGLLSMGDIVKHLVRERESTIQNLTDYIQGRA